MKEREKPPFDKIISDLSAMTSMHNVEFLGREGAFLSCLIRGSHATVLNIDHQAFIIGLMPFCFKLKY